MDAPSEKLLQSIDELAELCEPWAQWRAGGHMHLSSVHMITEAAKEVVRSLGADLNEKSQLDAFIRLGLGR
jgi:hypothetical protein